MWDARGWAANAAVPGICAQFMATVHVPRKFYTTLLPGIPTIRVFEALACGIPLVSAPWEDAEDLFSPGEDYLVADSPESMQIQVKHVLEDSDLAQELRISGLARIMSRHTCAHRVDELMTILGELRATRPVVEQWAAAE